MTTLFIENPLLQICFQIILFFIIIYALHFLWGYLLNILVPKKTIHIVDNQIEKYKQLVEEIQQNKYEKLVDSNIVSGSSPDMKSENGPSELDIIHDDLDEFIQSYL
jgi:hypothetical protein